MGNLQKSQTSGKTYVAAEDRKSYGLNGSTYGRVTLYCCPHDQVISAATVQGIGWRGLGSQELEDIGAEGVLTQRVFATNFPVGKCKEYHYWEDDWRHETNKTSGFWYPPSPPAKYGFRRALSANENFAAKLMTTATAPVLSIVTLVTSVFNMMPVNAIPPEGWTVKANAPELDEWFPPKALRFGRPIETVKVGTAESDFNEGNDPPAAARNADKANGTVPKQANDPYDNYKPEQADGAAEGTLQSEAAQRYEDHAILRMRARRDGNSNWIGSDGDVIGEDGKSAMPEGYETWHNAQVKEVLDAATKNNPTNHSTIMTNPMHARMALAYDVAIGLCYLSPEQLTDLRIEADWRFGKGIHGDNPNKKYSKYFTLGKLDNKFINDWVKVPGGEAEKPGKIADEREGEFYLKIGGVV